MTSLSSAATITVELPTTPKTPNNSSFRATPTTPTHSSAVSPWTKHSSAGNPVVNHLTNSMEVVKAVKNVAPPPSQASPSSSRATGDNPSVTNYDEGSRMIIVGVSCPNALKRPNWSIGDFDIRKLCYNGGISMVYHAVDRQSGISVAIKLYKRAKLNEIERHQVAREIRLHSTLNNEAIIGMFAAWKDRHYVYIALEWAHGGDVYCYLRSRGGKLCEELAVKMILFPFMEGIHHLHKNGIIHRDIKPENILLNSSYQVKLADFGLSIDSKTEISNTRLGTIDYLAPEILNCPVKEHPQDFKNNPLTGYTKVVDCWSIGVLAYELLTGSAPFASADIQRTLRMITSKHVLVRDPERRPSVAELMTHPWITKYTRKGRDPLQRQLHRSNSAKLLLPTVESGTPLPGPSTMQAATNESLLSKAVKSVSLPENNALPLLARALPLTPPPPLNTAVTAFASAASTSFGSAGGGRNSGGGPPPAASGKHRLLSLDNVCSPSASSGAVSPSNQRSWEKQQQMLGQQQQLGQLLRHGGQALSQGQTQFCDPSALGVVRSGTRRRWQQPPLPPGHLTLSVLVLQCCEVSPPDSCTDTLTTLQAPPPCGQQHLPAVDGAAASLNRANSAYGGLDQPLPNLELLPGGASPSPGQPSRVWRKLLLKSSPTFPDANTANRQAVGKPVSTWKQEEQRGPSTMDGSMGMSKEAQPRGSSLAVKLAAWLRPARFSSNSTRASNNMCPRSKNPSLELAASDTPDTLSSEDRTSVLTSSLSGLSTTP
ncbi:MAG: hypothetical protein WDW38_009133 [Sanguina aurantia]